MSSHSLNRRPPAAVGLGARNVGTNARNKSDVGSTYPSRGPRRRHPDRPTHRDRPRHLIPSWLSTTTKVTGRGQVSGAVTGPFPRAVDSMLAFLFIDLNHFKEINDTFGSFCRRRAPHTARSPFVGVYA